MNNTPDPKTPVTQQTIDEEIHECPMCDGNDNALLGVLGWRVQLRCRCCGFDHSFKLSKPESKEK